MKKLKNINTVSELLTAVSDKQVPVIVNIRPDSSNNHYLMDQVANRMATRCNSCLDLFVLDKKDANDLKKELRLMKTPILLVIYKGVIESVFSGNVSYKKIEDAVKRLFEKMELKNPLAEQAGY
jgi:diphthamide synthase (EF-2-diphthine--ammonia ligase)